MSSKATTRSSSSRGNSKTSTWAKFTDRIRVPTKARLPLGPAAKNDLANKYLIFYNVASGLAWAYVLIFALIHITNIDGRAAQVASSGPVTASSYVGKLLSSSASFLRSASSATKAHSRWWLSEQHGQSVQQPEFRRRSVVAAVVESCVGKVAVTAYERANQTK